MIKVYILNTQSISDDKILELSAQLPFGEAERIRLSAIESSKHKKESLGGLLALQRLVTKDTPDFEGEICRTTGGKPYFKDHPSLPFGISHSHGIAAAALGDSDCADIGFDLEVIDESADAQRIAERYFSSTEKRELEKNGNSAEAFFAVWTAKESYAKLDGRGLAAILSDKQAKMPENTYLSRLTVDVGGKRAIFSIVCRSQGQAIQIFSDSEEKQ